MACLGLPPLLQVRLGEKEALDAALRFFEDRAANQLKRLVYYQVGHGGARVGFLGLMRGAYARGLCTAEHELVWGLCAPGAGMGVGMGSRDGVHGGEARRHACVCGMDMLASTRWGVRHSLRFIQHTAPASPT